jgi:hypothetical protein
MAEMADGMADGMEEWRNGGMAEWQKWRMEWRMEWRNGGWNGGMAEWRNGGNGGRMAEWLNGGNGYLPTIFMVHTNNDDDDDNTNTFKSYSIDKLIGAMPQRHFFGGEGGVWYEKGVPLRGLRISKKKEILCKLTVL